MKPARAVLNFLAFTVCVYAQPSTPPAFDVASVKQNTVGINEGPGHGPENVSKTPTSLTMQNVRLNSALKWAYQLQDDQISGPVWLKSERYDIFAKTGTPVPEEELRRRLQNLLADRFGLKCHRETKVMPAFALVVAKDGPKLKKSAGDGESSITAVGKPEPGFTLDFLNTSVSQLADRISGSMGAPVVDMTGLKDRYNFTLDISRYLTGGSLKPEDMAAILSQAVQEQLGLRLAPKKLPVEILVIDYVERVPTAN
jgi:uncharacterized protein (TIGR03435 family)